MKERIKNFFSGRNGMDELNRVLTVAALVCLVLSGLAGGILRGVLSFLLSWAGIMALVFSVYRTFSRDLYRRRQENEAWLAFLQKKRDGRAAARERRKQKDYVFFKCPGCGQYLRVPKGKGKIHINCKCGYTMYRKT